ncbi:hypothetical protein GCM10009624_26860 [Gordonia sinesedis]
MPDRSDAASDSAGSSPPIVSPPDASIAEKQAPDAAPSPTFTMIGADGAVCVDGVCAWPGAKPSGDTGDHDADDGTSSTTNA